MFFSPHAKITTVAKKKPNTTHKLKDPTVGLPYSVIFL